MMKSYLRLALLLPLISMIGLPAFAQILPLPPSGDNQQCMVTQYIGSIVHVTVTYRSPDVTGPDGRDRTGQIWGTPVAHYGLVDQGYGLGQPAPWRAGANECTTIEFSHPVHIEGHPIPAGKYALFLELAESGPWTWVFARNHAAWGSYFYERSDEVLRVAAMPGEHPHTEWLTYQFTDRRPESTVLELLWERKRMPMRITVPDMTDIYVAAIQAELTGTTTGFTAQPYIDAARFLLNRNEQLPQALAWIDRSLQDPFFGRKDFGGLTTRAQILLRMGDTEEALITIAEAMELPGTSANEIHAFGRNLIAIGQREEALRIFEINFNRFQGQWPTPVGMARGLSALGRYKEALAHAEAGLRQAPDEQNRTHLKALIERLKAGQDIN